MASTRQLYVEGLEHHQVFIEQERLLYSLGRQFAGGSVTGNEDFQDASDGLKALKSLGSGLFSVAKWTGDKALTGLSYVMSATGDSLTKAFSDNKVLIQKITEKLKADTEKEYHFSESVVASLTIEGDLDKLQHDMGVLLQQLELLDKHQSAILDFLDKQLVQAKKFKSVKTTEDLFKVVEDYEQLEFPHFNLPHSEKNEHHSDPLPGGKVWTVTVKEGGGFTYAIGGEPPAASAGVLTLGKSDVSSLLGQLGKINAMHIRLKGAYDGYLASLKAWAEMVKSVEPTLGKLDRVSKTAISQAERILAGDTQALAFYSGFTPRVVSYVDRYIHGVLGVFA